MTATAGQRTATLDRHDTAALLKHQTRVMQLIADGAELAAVLDAVALALEQLIGGAHCSILLLEPGAATLRHGAAPTLPVRYSSAIDGMRIGPAAGSCGTAAYLGTPVVAEDVAVDPRWRDYRDLALPHGLRACWSSPISGREGTVGTFAVYHRRPHRPDRRERDLVDRFTQLASVAVDHQRMAQAEFARRSAEAASRAKSQFVSALSHELRTPLQAITGFTELLGGLDLTPTQRREALGHISDAARHILALVDDVLDLSRIEAGALPMRPCETDAVGVAREVLGLLRPLATQRSVALRLDAAPTMVRADPRRLRQVLLNVIGNGVRYNAPGGEVRVSAGDDGAAHVLLSIADTGPGIPENRLDRLFVPFDRLDADETAERGTGLGLVVARSLAEAMGGSLDVSSGVGVGTTVRVRLPAAADPPA